MDSLGTDRNGRGAPVLALTAARSGEVRGGRWILLSSTGRKLVPLRGVARVSLLTDPARQMRLTIETEREDDGRWIAEVMELPGAMAYGESCEDATRRVKALALRVVAERLEQGEPSPRPNTIQFAAA